MIFRFHLLDIFKIHKLKFHLIDFVKWSSKEFSKNSEKIVAFMSFTPTILQPRSILKNLLFSPLFCKK